MDAQDLKYVVAHEQAHIRRKDHWWKPLGFLLLGIHWFNPLMWLAYVLLCRDIELACDEKVIKELGNEQRADYTQALVACSVNRRMITACPLAFGEVGVKDRVKSVMNYKKPRFWVVVLAVLSCVIVAVCFLTDPAVPDDPVYSGDPAEIEEDRRDIPFSASQTEPQEDVLDIAISNAILDHYASDHPDGLVHVASHVLLANEAMSGTPKVGEDIHSEEVIVYLLVLHEAYSTYGGTLEAVGGDYVPTAITFSVDESGAFILKEYWEPRDGSYYAKDIRAKFPGASAEDALNHQAYIRELQTENYQKALAYLNRNGGLDLLIADLLDAIASSPAASSDPGDHIDAHEEEYRELLGYGQYTLRYCFSAFLSGGQTDLRGRIMAHVCEGVSDAWGEALLFDEPVTGQEWFDALKDHAESLEEQFDADRLEKSYPVSWLLLQMINE